MANVWRCIVSMDYPTLHAGLVLLTEDSSMITVSSSVKIQQVLSGLERQAKTLGIHMHFCGFSFIHCYIYYYVYFFPLCVQVLFTIAHLTWAN